MEVYYLAVFKSRDYAVKLNALLGERGVFTGIVTTPKDISKACGVSVKLLPYALKPAQQIISENGIEGFVGFYRFDGTIYSKFN